MNRIETGQSYRIEWVRVMRRSVDFTRVTNIRTGATKNLFINALLRKNPTTAQVDALGKQLITAVQVGWESMSEE